MTDVSLRTQIETKWTIFTNQALDGVVEVSTNTHWVLRWYFKEQMLREIESVSVSVFQ